MADIGTAYFKLKPSTEGISNEVEKALTHGDPGGTSGKQVGGFFKSAFAGAIGGITASLTSGIVNVAKQGLQNITNSVDALAGYDYSMKFIKIDEGVVAKNKALLKEYSLSTMYSMNDVLDTSKVLASTGVKNFGELTKSLGNVVAMGNGTGETFKSMSNVMGKIQTAGKVTGDTWSQITNNIPEMAGLLKEELKSAGAYTGDFATALRKGEISADAFNLALEAVDKNSNGMGESFAKGSSFFSGALNSISNAVEKVGIDIVDKLGQENLTKFFNIISSAISKAGDLIVATIGFISNNWGWLAPVTAGVVGLCIAFKGFMVLKSATSAVKTFVSASKGLTSLTGLNPASGAGAGGFLKGLASGLKAFAFPQILLGATILGASMVILAGASWASIKIIADALPDLGDALGSFNKVNGANLVVVGGGLIALGLGLTALTAGSVINGISSFLGFGNFGDTLKSIVDPIIELMPKLNISDINKFSLIASGLVTLGGAYATIPKGDDRISVLSKNLMGLKDAVNNIVDIGMDKFEQIGTAIPQFANSLKSFDSINGENLASIGTGLTGLGIGLLAISNGAIVDGLMSLMGAGFGNTLKSIIEPIALLMPSITEESINKFNTLGGGLSALAKGFSELQGTNGIGQQVANDINKLKDAVAYAVNGADTMYNQLANQFTKLKSSLDILSQASFDSSNLTSYLDNIANKLRDLNGFDWSGAVNNITNKAKGMGTAIGQGIQNGINQIPWASYKARVTSEGNAIGSNISAGIVAGINGGQSSILSAISSQIDSMVAQAKAKAKIKSPSRVFRDEVGYWLGAGVGVGFDNGIENYDFSIKKIQEQVLKQDDTIPYPQSLQDLKRSITNEPQQEPITIEFPKELKIVDNEGLIMKVKPIIDDKILRNNIDYKLI